MATPAGPQKLVRQWSYPPIDFRIGCCCAACEVGTLLFYTEDEHPARAAWEVFWNRWFDRENDEEGRFWEGRPCLWQWSRVWETEATPKPTAYKIC